MLPHRNCVEYLLAISPIPSYLRSGISGRIRTKPLNKTCFILATSRVESQKTLNGLPSDIPSRLSNRSWKFWRLSSWKVTWRRATTPLFTWIVAINLNTPLLLQVSILWKTHSFGSMRLATIYRYDNCSPRRLINLILGWYLIVSSAFCFINLFGVRGPI